MILKSVVLFIMTTALVNTSSLDLECPDRCTCSETNGFNLTVCQEKGFQSIPDNISPHTNFLDLSANNLGRLQNYTFSTMKLIDLQSIVLRQAGIIELGKYTFANLRWLKELDLSENHIVTLDPFLFADNKILEMVNFSSNPLLTLTSFQFAPLPRLKSLDLHSCALTTIEREAFSNLFFVETLDLSNNSLASVPSDTFTWLPNLKNIGLSQNRWRCDCNIQMLTVSLQYRGLYTNQTCVYEELPNAVPVLWHTMDNITSACVPQILEHMREMVLSDVPRLRAPVAFHFMNTSARFSSHLISPAPSPHPWIVAIVSAIAVTVCLCCVIRIWAKRRRRSQNKFNEYGYEEEMAGLGANVYRDYLDEQPGTSGYQNENFCLLGDDDGDSDMSVSIGL